MRIDKLTCWWLWALLVIIAGCGSTHPHRVGPRMLKLGAPARDFIAKDIQGRVVRLGRYIRTDTGQPSEPKDVLLVFFATWCKPCHGGWPMLAEYQRNHPEVQVIVVALPSDDLNEVIDTLLQGNRDLFPVVEDQELKIFHKYFGKGRDITVQLPMIYFIERSGVVANRILEYDRGKNIDFQLFESRQK